MNFDNDFIKAVLKNVADGVVVCDENGVLIFFNSSLQELHGAALQPLHPHEWAEYYGLHYADGSGLMKMEDIPLYRAWKGNKVENAEMLIISKDGTKIYVIADGNQIKNADGKVAGAVVNMHNISAIKQAEKKLLEIQHFSQKISDTTAGLITVFNINTGIYLYVNKSSKRILGYLPGEMIEGGFQNAVLLIHPVDRQMVLEKIQTEINIANSTYPNYNDDDAKEFEYRIRHKNGEYVWLHTYSVIFTRDGNNKVEQVINISVDVTERKNAEIRSEQLKISEDYFRDLADQSPFMIWKVDAEGLCTYVNKRWCDFTGLSFEESLHLGWGVAFHPDEAEPEYAKFMSCFKMLKPYNSKFRLKTKEGEYRWVMAQSNPLQQKGKGYIGSLTDITEQEQAQQAMRLLMQKKDEFMSIASHELKTPITSMKASLQIAERLSAKDPEQSSIHSFIQKANRQVNKLTNLVDDLLDVTKIHAGKMQFNKSEFPIHEVIEDCIEQMRYDSDTHNIIAEGETNIIVSADKERIEQVLTNFLSNAIKYSPNADKIILTATSDEGFLKIAVTDFGIGIPSDKIQFIFDRFFRVQESSQKFSGLGLGLYISAEIISRHEGKIGVDSKEGKGSTFWFTIPL